jgi:hypothetical protein
MIAVAPLVLAALMPLGIPQSGDAGRTYSVTRMCGKLVRLHTPVVKTGSFSETTYVPKNLKGIRVKLYRREINASCCAGFTPVGQATTSHSGNFRFKRNSAGSYWFVAQVDGSEYQMPILYEPTKGETVPLCSDCWYQIDDSGAFTFAMSISVTVE